MSSPDRSLGKKLFQWAVADVPFHVLAGDRELELRIQRDDLKIQHVKLNEMKRLNGLVMEALTQRHGEISVPEQAAGNSGTFAEAQGAMSNAQDLLDAMRQDQAVNVAIGREITYSLEDIRDALDRSTDVQRSAVAVMEKDVNERRLLRELFQEELTTLPEVVLQEMIRNETDRLNIAHVVELMRRDIHRSLQRHGERGSSEAAAALALRYFRGSLTDLSANAVTETAFLTSRTEAMNRMIVEILKRTKQGDIPEGTVRTGKIAMRTLMEREVDFGEMRRRFEGRRRKLIQQYADFWKRTQDTHLLKAVENATGERMKDVSTLESEALRNAGQRGDEAGKVLESISGIRLPVRSIHASTSPENRK